MFRAYVPDFQFAQSCDESGTGPGRGAGGEPSGSKFFDLAYSACHPEPLVETTELFLNWENISMY